MVRAKKKTDNPPCHKISIFRSNLPSAKDSWLFLSLSTTVSGVDYMVRSGCTVLLLFEARFVLFS